VVFSTSGVFIEGILGVSISMYQFRGLLHLIRIYRGKSKGPSIQIIQRENNKRIMAGLSPKAMGPYMR
jgi:hypothetical protein